MSRPEGLHPGQRRHPRRRSRPGPGRDGGGRGGLFRAYHVCPAPDERAGGLETAIRAPTPATWAYAENFVPEDDVLARARARATELGCPAVHPGTGAAL